LDIIVGFLPGDERGDEQGAAGVLPGVDQGFHAFGGVFDDVENEAEVDHVGGLFLNLRRVDWVPAPGVVAEFANCFDIAAVAAAVVEERFAAAELAEFEQGFDGLGDLASDERGLVAVDFLLRRGRCRKCGDFCFNETMAFEARPFSARIRSQLMRKPMRAVSSSSPATSSCRVSFENFPYSGCSGGRKVSLRWRIGGLARVR
jgi:hypothetical protein